MSCLAHGNTNLFPWRLERSPCERMVTTNAPWGNKPCHNAASDRRALRSDQLREGARTPGQSHVRCPSQQEHMTCCADVPLPSKQMMTGQATSICQTARGCTQFQDTRQIVRNSQAGAAGDSGGLLRRGRGSTLHSLHEQLLLYRGGDTQVVGRGTGKQQ